MAKEQGPLERTPPPAPPDGAYLRIIFDGLSELPESVQRTVLQTYLPAIRRMLDGKPGQALSPEGSETLLWPVAEFPDDAYAAWLKIDLRPLVEALKQIAANGDLPASIRLVPKEPK